jgi:hypothetical protein
MHLGCVDSTATLNSGAATGSFVWSPATFTASRPSTPDPIHATPPRTRAKAAMRDGFMA